MIKTKQDQKVIDWLKKTDSIMDNSKMVDDIGLLLNQLQGSTFIYAEAVDEAIGACSALIMVFRQDQQDGDTRYKIVTVDGYHEDYNKWEYSPLQMFYMEKNVN